MTTEDLMLAEYLKQLRRNSRLTINGWCIASGISRTTLWRWERGKTLPHNEELNIALNALGASAKEKVRARELLFQERVTRGVRPGPGLAGLRVTGQNGTKRNELLKALRLRSGYTQRQAAEQLGVNRVSLARWEAGEHWPDVVLLRHACRLYQALPDEVLSLTSLSLPSDQGRPLGPDDVVLPI